MEITDPVLLAQIHPTSLEMRIIQDGFYFLAALCFCGWAFDGMRK